MDALILDFDGVIADSEPAHERSLREVAERSRLSMSHELYLSRIIGLDDRDTYRTLAEVAGRSITEEEIAALARQKHARFVELVERGEVKLFQGTLDLVREAWGTLPIAICSGATRVEIEAILEHAGVRHFFEVIVTADDVEKAKPDPSGYLLAAEKLGVPAMNCTGIEDTDKGIAAAKGAGLSVIGVCHSLPRERLTQADVVIDSSAGLTLARLRELIGA